MQWPDCYIDEEGQAHDWDDPVPVEDEDTDEEPMTYRELAYDLASAQGIDIEDFLARQALRRGDVDEMSPSWIDDDAGYGL